MTLERGGPGECRARLGSVLVGDRRGGPRRSGGPRLDRRTASRSRGRRAGVRRSLSRRRSGSGPARCDAGPTRSPSAPSERGVASGLRAVARRDRVRPAAPRDRRVALAQRAQARRRHVHADGRRSTSPASRSPRAALRIMSARPSRRGGHPREGRCWSDRAAGHLPRRGRRPQRRRRERDRRRMCRIAGPRHQAPTSPHRRGGTPTRRRSRRSRVCRKCRGCGSPTTGGHRCPGDGVGLLSIMSSLSAAVGGKSALRVGETSAGSAMRPAHPVPGSGNRAVKPRRASAERRSDAGRSDDLDA